MALKSENLTDAPRRHVPPPMAVAPAPSDDILHHLPALRSYARSLCRKAQDADDLVQETLLRAIEYAHSYRPGTHLRAWLFTIMRSRFYNNCRRASREMTGGADCVSALPQSQPSQEWHLRQGEMLAIVNAMPVHYREALVLVAVLGESYLHAAAVLNCDVGTVKSRVFRARQILRKSMDG
ncbi:sigma-70 family RNA polymerase sigma factor [Paracoccus sp. SSK6]|uniref:sigma-70 family RNA polymerase sigma factor n=1 Tax=Paracoccus sp. SSK6 TaxID=3143131 RepID=UPI00321AD25C